MINENFIDRVIQVLVERRLNEGVVKAANKAAKNKFMLSKAKNFKGSKEQALSFGRENNAMLSGPTPERKSSLNRMYRGLAAKEIGKHKKSFKNFSTDTKPKLP